MTILSLRRPSATVAFQGRHGRGDSAAGWVTRCHHTLRCWMERSRQRRALREIAETNDFHLLKDIGVSQEKAFREADKVFWRS